MVLRSPQWLQADQRHLEASQNTSQMLATQAASVLMALAAQVATLLAVHSVSARARLASRRLWVATRQLHHHLVPQALALLLHHRVSLLQVRASHQPRRHTRQHLRALVRVYRLHPRTIHRRHQAIRLRLQRLVHRLHRTTRRRPRPSVRHHPRRLRHLHTALLLRCTAQRVRRMVVVEVVQASSHRPRRTTHQHLRISVRQARHRPQVRRTPRRARCTIPLQQVLAVSRVHSTHPRAQCTLLRLPRKTRFSRS